MIRTIITPSHVLVLSLLSSAADAQSGSSSSPLASPNATPHTWDVSLAPVFVAVVCVFFFVSIFAIYLDHCSDLDLAAGDPTGVTDNCSSSGIDPRLLDTFPILMYSAVEHLRFGKAAVAECAVCLSEFDHRDRLRLLPKCNHVFHSQCIDAWLASHVTCPVCRSRLKPAEEQRGHENDVVIVIPNESSERRTEVHSGDR